MSGSSSPVLDTATLEEALEAGFLGSVPDPTPNEEYALPGGATPETDQAAREAAQARMQELINRFSNRTGSGGDSGSASSASATTTSSKTSTSTSSSASSTS